MELGKLPENSIPLKEIDWEGEDVRYVLAPPSTTIPPSASAWQRGMRLWAQCPPTCTHARGTRAARAHCYPAHATALPRMLPTRVPAPAAHGTTMRMRPAAGTWTCAAAGPAAQTARRTSRSSRTGRARAA